MSIVAIFHIEIYLRDVSQRNTKTNKYKISFRMKHARNDVSCAVQRQEYGEAREVQRAAT